MYKKEISFTDSELYDIFNTNCTEDIAMYLKLCSNAHNVLELGVGTGRVAIPLAKSGINVVGIDNSSIMLETLQKKIKSIDCCNISIIKQNICNLKLNQFFDYVICPFCTFNFLLTLKEQESALKALRKHLTERAIVVFDLMTPNTFSYVMQDCNKVFFDTIDAFNYTIDIYINSSFNQVDQLFTQERIFEIKNGKTLLTREYLTMRNRIFLLGEFKLLLEKCGYRIVKVYGDYSFSSFKCDSKNLVVLVTPY